MNTKVLRCFYFDKTENFGDRLTPIFLSHYGIKHKPSGIRHSSEQALCEAVDLFGIGSLLHNLPNDTTDTVETTPIYRGRIWSTGFMYPDKRAVVANALQVLAVRGRLSLERIRAVNGNSFEHVVVGDGGLIIDRVFPREKVLPPGATEPTYTLGILPHYSDTQYIKTKFAQYLSDPRVVLIDPLAPLQTVLCSILSCKAILSSSLHGLITADAYGIPNRQFLVATSEKIGGGLFKYRDYYSCYKRDFFPEPINLDAFPNIDAEQLSEICVKTWFPRPGIDKIKDGLEKTLKSLKPNPFISDNELLWAREQLKIPTDTPLDVPDVVWAFWTNFSTDPLPEPRARSVETLRKQCAPTRVILVTDAVLNPLKHLLHPAYPYLHATHRADYLRCWFLANFGGGYHDVKASEGYDAIFAGAFDILRGVDPPMMVGYRELPNEYARISNDPDMTKKLRENVDKILGLGTLATRARSALMREWLESVHSLLDSKLEALQKFHDNKPSDWAEDYRPSKSKGAGSYPIAWTQLLGWIIHPLMLKYHTDLRVGIPIVNLKNYR